jgi:Tol biopolymer transport system component
VFPSWSPDESQIVFVSNLIQRRNGGGGIDPLDGDIYIVPANGGPVRDVTQNRIFEDWWVQWSPDGERLLILSSPGDWSAPAKSNLYLLDLASDEIEKIPVDEWQLSLPFWSPDGMKIAYVTGGDTINIWSNLGLRIVPLGSDVLSFVTWSPDGRDMLVPSIARSTPSYVVDVDGNVTPIELGYDSMSGANGPPIWGGITSPGTP